MDERKGELADKDFRDWFDKRIKELAVPATQMLKRGKEHRPMLLIYSTDGEVAALPLDFDTSQDKNYAAGLQRHLAQHSAIYAVVLVTEAWALVREPSDPNLWKSIADHPDRIEILMFNAIHRNQQLLAKYVIDRKTKTLGEVSVIDPCADVASEGRMILNRPTRH